MTSDGNGPHIELPPYNLPKSGVKVATSAIRNEVEKVGRVRDIDDEAINRLVANAEKTRAKAEAALDQLVANGIDVSWQVPDGIKYIGGYTVRFHLALATSRVAPVSAAAVPQSAEPPK